MEIIDISGGESHRIVQTYMELLPAKLKAYFDNHVESIILCDISLSHGNGNCSIPDEPNGPVKITTGSTPNVYYHIELLGHELGHAANVEDKFSRLCDKSVSDPHLLCDDFSQYILYGNGKHYSDFAEEYGERQKEVISALYAKINAFQTEEDKRIDMWLARNRERFGAEFADDMKSCLYNKDARFLRRRK